MTFGKLSAKVGRRAPRISAGVIGGTGLLLLFAAQADLLIAAPSAVADPEIPGCSSDYSVSNEMTMKCEPGSGQGQHAFIRCRDLVGIAHTHIGPTIGSDGGWSRAVCAPGENGPA
ncbi:hypothetical protein [Nocardia arthritidis]|uniref:Uncharacterized protein n=1 Tax=Nocardia arthritidis TaxID=228602 RepID=A0A6G9YBS0_9NOCA|nr:hypothetical protein [Nocardia arthritidis]QIS10527.1 hypothetical protein F5544_13190 [Nocardia arthritidis]